MRASLHHHSASCNAGTIVIKTILDLFVRGIERSYDKASSRPIRIDDEAAHLLANVFRSISVYRTSSPTRMFAMHSNLCLKFSTNTVNKFCLWR